MKNFFSVLLGKNDSAAKRRNKLPKAIAFVDYEHWYISMEKLHHLRPNIQLWFDDIKEKCNIVEVMFFADFSKYKEKEKEIKRIRKFTNKIIDTYNPDLCHVKDYTDFIILDNIYQKALSCDDIDMFILFSGDGHFSSACAFLRNFCNKEVGVYGVKACVSKNLVNNSDWVVEVPFEAEVKAPILNLLLSNLNTYESGTDKKPTFQKTVEIISSKYHLSSSIIKDTLVNLINSEYVDQVYEKGTRSETVRVLKPNWEKIREDKIWDKESLIV